MTIDQAVERQRSEDVERGFSGEPERVEREYDADTDPNWKPHTVLPGIHYARVDGKLQVVSAEEYGKMYPTEGVA
jgi:hypothetical protein